MKPPRILITGASGLLGGHLCLAAQRAGEVYGAYLSHRTLVPGVQPLLLNLSDEANLAHALAEVRPRMIVHAAVLQVDACERDPVLAERINVQASRRLAEWCAHTEARMLYISSDLVFAGERGRYVETDEAQPVMLYGKNKLAAEQAVLASCRNACVVRLPLMYGFPAAGGNNFFLSLIAKLQQGERVPVFHDQYRTPGWVNNMAEAVWELACSDFCGRLHVAGTTRCSRLEMAQWICRLGGWNEALLQPLAMHDVPLAAPRPQDVSLDTRLASRFLKTKLFSLEEGLRHALRVPGSN